MATTFEPPKAATEDELWASYANDPAVRLMRRTVRKPCVCRGVVEADPSDPALDVAMHNATSRHQAWRRGRDQSWD